IGGKIRFTGPNNPLGAGIIPFWRWWLDRPSDFSGFNQMQRGAGPGASIGDFGLIGFVGGRLSRSVNVSANGGVILNSNPRTDAMGGSNVVLLDRPNEFLAGVGFDFPINRHFQPIAELNSVNYWGSRTPNAFPQNPVDFLGGVKIYPRRWFGFGVWYRMNLNQQSEGHFNKSAATAATVALSATATDPDGDTLLYTWSTTGGRVTGDGPNATLDLTGASPGTYTVTVEVDDGCGCVAFTSTTVTVNVCGCVSP